VPDDQLDRSALEEERPLRHAATVPSAPGGAGS
jgi:hypothetical protein